MTFLVWSKVCACCGTETGSFPHSSFAPGPRPRHIIMLLLFLLVSFGFAAEEIPRRNFTLDQLRWFHGRLEDEKQHGQHAVFSAAQQDYLDSLSEEQHLRARRQVPPHPPWRNPNRVSIRKEYRMLTDSERNRFHAAANALKNDRVDGMRKWDILTLQHNPTDVPNAHWGPAFLPWHREFVRRVEVALKHYDPGVAIPYWDSTMDHDLPDPKDSILWTENFMGNGEGYVTTGPFAYWPTYDHLSQQPSITRLYRSLGTHPRSALYSPRDLAWIQSRTHYRDLSFCEDQTFEMTHGLQHLYVGGFLEPLRQSPNDPVFYILHSFVDHLWEMFREQRQSPQQRETQWGTVLCKAGQNIDDPMHPFPGIRNRDGLANHYTQDWYRYEARPQCIRGLCGSPYLWCDNASRRCRSKIRPGGNCRGLESTAACFASNCVRGICSNGSSLLPTPSPPRRVQQLETAHLFRPTTPAGRAQLSPDMIGYIKVLLFGYNGLVRDNSYGVKFTGTNVAGTFFGKPNIGNIRFPMIDGIVIMRIPIPSAAIPTIEGRLEAQNPYGEPCSAHCFNFSTHSFAPCSGEIRLSHRSWSSPIAWTHDESTSRFLNADLRGHPQAWAVSPPHINFLCDRQWDANQILHHTQAFKAPYSTAPMVWFPVIILDRQQPNRISVRDAVASVTEASGLGFSTKVEPSNFGLVILEARNPNQAPGGILNLQIGVTAWAGKPCVPICGNDRGSGVCSGNITLSNDPSRSSFPFFEEREVTAKAGWTLIGPQSNWQFSLSPLSFYCYASERSPLRWN